MLKRVSDLLHTVDRESRVLDAAEARALRNEIEGHLDAAIMARLELGATPEEAEHEAVAAFGNIRQIVRAMRPAETHHWVDKRFFVTVGLGWFTLVAVAFGGAAVFAQYSALVNLLVIGLSLGLAALVARESVRARKVQILPILVLFPIFSLLGAIGQATTTLPEQDGASAIGRDAARAEIRTLSGRIADHEAALAQMKVNRAAFDRGENIAPSQVRLDATLIQYGPAASLTEARQGWHDVDGWKAQAYVIMSGSRMQIEALTKRLEAPLITSGLGWLGISAGITAAPVALTILLNAFVAFAAWLTRRFSRRGQTV